MASKSIPSQGAIQYIHRCCRWWQVNISADAPQTALFFSRLKRDLMGRVMKCPKYHARTFRFCFLGFASNQRSGRVITKGLPSQAFQAVQGQLQQPSDMHVKLNILLLAAVIVSFFIGKGINRVSVGFQNKAKRDRGRKHTFILWDL